ncbi:DinB family protein [Solitalea sp. MAHUQ-68]|uniref:DinB family protein n=1 Tax=Solitalea agri TaxID=2953739 RepID=A0A9X2F6B5_9SPHI|nr:DinB family protein [Solitalea agri]MCO4293191.1 DinB family protein [Solitalea agri]
MKQVNWFDRKFDFTYQQNIFPSIIERLAGTVLRLEHKLAKISERKHTVKPDNGWSILEHIGHLSDLEPLWQIRLEEILSGKEFMSSADLQNTKTNEAGHNNKSFQQLITEFSALREQTLKMIESLNEEEIYRSSLHPRLKTPMRTMDLFLFVAEHDDHHLAKITELDRLIS